MNINQAGLFISIVVTCVAVFLSAIAFEQESERVNGKDDNSTT